MGEVEALEQKLRESASKFSDELVQFGVALLGRDDWKMSSIVEKNNHIKRLYEDLEHELSEKRKLESKLSLAVAALEKIAGPHELALVKLSKYEMVLDAANSKTETAREALNQIRGVEK